MVWFYAVLLGLAIGGVLGALGGGGAILTVPALVYVLGERAQDATAASLVIVGVSALAGVATYVGARRVEWKTAVLFAVVGFPATWVGSLANHHVNENVLLLGFAGLMLVAATAMVAHRPAAASNAGAAVRVPLHAVVSPDAAGGQPREVGVAAAAMPAHPTTYARSHPVVAVPVALGVGLLTGFFGVGGGFVIVPALVLVLHLPMRRAVGTSLLIVAANSATSLVTRLGSAHFDWTVIVPFTLAAIAATLLGKRVADRLPHRQLTVGFAVLLGLVAIYTGAQSLQGLLS
jgi:uncharacterized membrane protein YfcA